MYIADSLIRSKGKFRSLGGTHENELEAIRLEANPAPVCARSRCLGTDRRSEGVRARRLQFPAQSVSHDRRLGEDARGKDLGTNVAIEFGPRRKCVGG